MPNGSDRRTFEALQAVVDRHLAERQQYLDRLGFDWTRSARIDHGEIEQNPLSAPETLKLALDDGRTVVLHELHQFNVYEGTLAGVPPTPEGELIAAMEAERLFPALPAVVLEPQFHTATFSTRPGAQPFPYPLIWIPSVCSIARFLMNTPIRGSTEPYSALVVVWFQNAYGMPCGATRAQMRAMDWDTTAVDWVL